MGELPYYEISPLISTRLAVFPGDCEFSRKVTLDMAKGDPLHLSDIHTTVHIGAHVDAPNHYAAGAADIASQKLDFYFGNCQVISVAISRGERIRIADLNGRAITEKRVLLKTGSFPNPEKWNSDFNSLSTELVDFLADRGVCMIGIDTPSIDPAEDKKLEAHRAIARRGLANLEGIVLDQVPDGVYGLVALPLRIEGADASPVRAVLFKPGILG